MKKVIATKEGELLTPPSSDSEIAQLIYLLEWARVRGFKIGPTVQIGELVVQVADLRQIEGGRTVDKDLGIWAEHGHTEG